MYNALCVTSKPLLDKGKLRGGEEGGGRRGGMGTIGYDLYMVVPHRGDSKNNLWMYRSQPSDVEPVDGQVWGRSRSLLHPGCDCL